MIGDPHTPGPWSYGDEDEDFSGFAYVDVHAGQYGDGYRSIAHVQGENADDFESAEITAEVRANARLIAAAPDLLAAIKGLMEVLCGTWDCDECGGTEQWKAAQAAVAKVEARS